MYFKLCKRWTQFRFMFTKPLFPQNCIKNIVAILYVNSTIEQLHFCCMNLNIKLKNGDLKGKNKREHLVRSDFERCRTEDNGEEFRDVNMG